jgi:hypothetical protein
VRVASACRCAKHRTGSSGRAQRRCGVLAHVGQITRPESSELAAAQARALGAQNLASERDLTGSPVEPGAKIAELAGGVAPNRQRSETSWTNRPRVRGSSFRVSGCPPGCCSGRGLGGL